MTDGAVVGLRSEGGRVQVPVLTLRRAGAGAVTVVGMVHVGEPAFYAEVEGMVRAHLTGGGVVLSEGVRPPAEDARPSAPVARAVAALEVVRLVPELLVRGTALVRQTEVMPTGLPGMRSNDVDAISFVEAHRSPRVLARRLRRCRWLLRVARRRLTLSTDELVGALRQLAQARGGGLGRGGVLRVVTGLEVDVVLGQRNAVAAAGCVAESARGADVLTTWGGAHVPGIVELLRAEGYALDGDVGWLTVLRAAPSSDAPA